MTASHVLNKLPEHPVCFEPIRSIGKDNNDDIAQLLSLVALQSYVEKLDFAGGLCNPINMPASRVLPDAN
jgi:hypothetical protein